MIALGMMKTSKKPQTQLIELDVLFVVMSFTKLASNMVLCARDMAKKFKLLI